MKLLVNPTKMILLVFSSSSDGCRAFANRRSQWIYLTLNKNNVNVTLINWKLGQLMLLLKLKRKNQSKLHLDPDFARKGIDGLHI